MALVVVAPGPKDPPKKDADPLLGTWAAEKAETGGMPRPVAGMTTEFRPGGKAVMADGGTPPQEGTYTADPKKDPHEIDAMAPAAGGSP